MSDYLFIAQYRKDICLCIFLWEERIWKKIIRAKFEDVSSIAFARSMSVICC